MTPQEVGIQLIETAKKADEKDPIGWMLCFVITALRSTGSKKQQIRDIVERNILIADKAIASINGQSNTQR